MRITTRDPITGNDISDRANAPSVVEGVGENALTIYFESEESRPQYMSTLPRTPQACSLNLYRTFENDEEILWDQHRVIDGESLAKKV